MAQSIAQITDDELAAALAAMSCYLEAEANRSQAAPAAGSAWQRAARLLSQGVAPARLPPPAWGNVERLRRIRNQG